MCVGQHSDFRFEKANLNDCGENHINERHYAMLDPEAMQNLHISVPQVVQNV